MHFLVLMNKTMLRKPQYKFSLNKNTKINILNEQTHRQTDRQTYKYQKTKQIKIFLSQCQKKKSTSTSIKQQTNKKKSSKKDTNKRKEKPCLSKK